jgi:hypothetical protein
MRAQGCLRRTTNAETSATTTAIPAAKPA